MLSIFCIPVYLYSRKSTQSASSVFNIINKKNPRLMNKPGIKKTRPSNKKRGYEFIQPNLTHEGSCWHNLWIVWKVIIFSIILHGRFPGLGLQTYLPHLPIPTFRNSGFHFLSDIITGCGFRHPSQ